MYDGTITGILVLDEQILDQLLDCIIILIALVIDLIG